MFGKKRMGLVLIVLTMVFLISMQVFAEGFELVEDFGDGDYRTGPLGWSLGSPEVDWHEYNNALEGVSLLDRCWKGDDQRLENHVWLYSDLEKTLSNINIHLRLSWPGDGLPAPNRQIGIGFVNEEFQGYGIVMSQFPDFANQGIQYYILKFNGPTFDVENTEVIEEISGTIRAQNDAHYFINFGFEDSILIGFAHPDAKEDEKDSFEVPVGDVYSSFNRMVIFRPAGALAHSSNRYMNLEIKGN